MTAAADGASRITIRLDQDGRWWIDCSACGAKIVSREYPSVDELVSVITDHLCEPGPALDVASRP